MRYLAVDLGDRRTGLAVGDDVTNIVTPLEVIDTAIDAERLIRIADAIHRLGPAALIVGLPLNMDGSEGLRARMARRDATSLQERLGIDVHLVDERLSSYAADKQLNHMALTNKKKRKRHDAFAAAAILRTFLDRGANESL